MKRYIALLLAAASATAASESCSEPESLTTG